MINSEFKRKYVDDSDFIDIIFNIDDSYKPICGIWCRWLKKNNLGLSLYSFRKYYSHLLQNHYSASTINANLVMMRKRILYIFDIDNNEIDKRYVLDHKMKEIKPPTAPPRNVPTESILSKRDINILISSCGLRSSLIIEFLYVTACRRAELCGCQIKDCCINKNVVTVSLYGKRNKIRKVYIKKDLFDRIRTIFNGKKYLFEKRDGEPYDGHLIWTIVSYNAKKKLNKKSSPHKIRHSRLTHLYEETNDMKAVSLFAGHSSIKTSLDFYVHTGFDKEIILGKSWEE